MSNSILEPTNVLYIKLGAGGEFEKECIASGKMKLGYHEIDHQMCKDGL